MGIINLLPENLINQIAAGEVVERPASVVKELTENALDAGAKRLIIEVEGGGDGYLRITDDGGGMDKEDALKAFERYATSKIASAEDLDNIYTLGFRGEALATIASVAYVTLQTKQKGSLEGTLIINEGGNIIKNKQVGCPEGTQIEVKQLFYNTPARKKYLKNEATEYGHILDTVTGMALANPGIAFKLVHDRRVVFDLPATEDSLSRIRGLLGRSVSQELIPVFYGHTKINLHGFIGKPAIARANRNGQHLFVNGRSVNSHVLSYAVKQSYHSLIPKEKNPVFVLFLNLSPELVDVNVHPRKMEVRFADEKEIFGVFLKACKTALEKHVLAPVFEVDGGIREHGGLGQTVDAAPVQSVVPVQSVMSVQNATCTSEELRAFEVENNNVGGRSAFEVKPDGFGGLVREEPETFNALTRTDEDELVPLAQLNNSYILCKQGDGLTIMDQHAAHERVRYEEILAEFEAKKIAGQPLLAPEQMEVSLSEAVMINENMDILAEMGFEIEPFGGNTFSVFSVPSYLVKEDIRATVMGILDDISDNSVKGDLQARKERALTYAACRSAVKFGDALSMDEMIALCKKLPLMKQPYTCPHGRPTMIKMSAAELEKKFGRKY